MTRLSAEDLSSWLATVQHYPAAAPAAERIAGAVSNAQRALQAIQTDSLFWTEPANSCSALSALSPRGIGDE